MDRIILDIDQIGKRQDKIWGNYPPNGNLPGSQYRVKPLSIVSTELPGVLNFVIKIDTHANQDHQNSHQKARLRKKNTRRTRKRSTTCLSKVIE